MPTPMSCGPRSATLLLALLVVCTSLACVPVRADVLMFFVATADQPNPPAEFSDLATLCKAMDANSVVAALNNASQKSMANALMADNGVYNAYVSATYNNTLSRYNWVIEDFEGVVTYEDVSTADFVDQTTPDNALFFVAYGTETGLVGLYPQTGEVTHPVLCITTNTAIVTTAVPTTTSVPLVTTTTAGPTPPHSDGNGSSSSKFPWWGILAIVLGIVVVLVVVLVVVCCCCFECVPADEVGNNDDDDGRADVTRRSRAHDERSFGGTDRDSRHSDDSRSPRVDSGRKESRHDAHSRRSSSATDERTPSSAESTYHSSSSSSV